MDTLPDTVLFDIDGTVADTLPAWQRASTDAAEAHSVQLSPADLLQIGSVRFDHVLAARGDLSEVLIRQIYDFRERILEDLLHEHAVWMDGAEEVLGTLRETRKIGIVTNAHNLGFDAIDRKLGLRKFADHVVTWDDVRPHGKPRPEPLLLAAQRFGVRPSDTVYVGDSDVDRAATEAAGMPFLLVPNSHPVQEFAHGRRLSSIRDLLGHL